MSVPAILFLVACCLSVLCYVAWRTTSQVVGRPDRTFLAQRWPSVAAAKIPRRAQKHLPPGRQPMSRGRLVLLNSG